MSFYLLAPVSHTHASSTDNTPFAAGPDTTNYPLGTRERFGTGPRSELVEFDFNNNSGAGVFWLFDEAHDADHVIITRQDLLLAAEPTLDYILYGRNSGGTRSAFANWELVSSGFTAVGPRDQDGVRTLSVTSNRDYGYGIGFRIVSTPFNFRLSDACFCKSTDIGYPSRESAPATELLPAGSQVVPIRGYFPYYTEKRFTLTWSVLSDSQITDFKNFLDEGNAWEFPVFLYDDTSSLWQHKLEHVILENFTVNQLGTSDTWSLTTTWQRLRHYR